MDWKYLLSRFILLTLGAVVAATSVVLFYLPSDFAPAGASGVSVILNELFGTPVGGMVIALNIPILFISYKALNNNLKLVLESAYTIGVYSILIDVMSRFINTDGLTNDLMLNALFGGIIGGIGAGLVYRAGGSMGGTSALAKVLREKYHLSMSTASLFTDTAILFAAALVFGWEAALYSTVALFVGRMASDYVLGGGQNTTTAVIVSRHGETVAKAIGDTLGRGFTRLKGRGFKGDEREVLLVTLQETEINALRKIIQLADDSAFVSILQGRTTFGKGFKSLEPRLPLYLDDIDDAASQKVDEERILEITES